MLIQVRGIHLTSMGLMSVAPKNVEQGILVNGSTGKVIEFLTISEAVARNIRIATLKKNGPSPEPEDQEYNVMRPINDNTFGPREKWPLVLFTTGCKLLCAPLEFTVEGFMGNVEARRLQVPLTLAWALSVHKSQGQTLTRVKVDLGRIFERGQGMSGVFSSLLDWLEVQSLQHMLPSLVQRLWKI